MWNLLDEISWSNTNQFNTERFGCSETQLKIVVNFKNTHVFSIFDDSKINGIWINNGNNFTEKDTVIERVEERVAIASDWKVLCKIGIILKDNVNQFRECCNLCW